MKSENPSSKKSFEESEWERERECEFLHDGVLIQNNLGNSFCDCAFPKAKFDICLWSVVYRDTSALFI